MADEIYQACDREQRDRDMLIAAQRVLSKTQELPVVGRCYNCHSQLGKGLKFCDRYCASDFEDRQKAAKRAGRSLV